MKALLLTLAIMILSIGLCANPVNPSVVSEAWFADNGHFMIEFAPYPAPDIGANIVIIKGELQLAVQCDSAYSLDNPYVIDVNQLMPSMIFNPNEDTLIVKRYYNNYLYDANHISWGNHPYYHDITPLQPGQSIANTQWLKICKDEPPTPGYNTYNPVARDTLKVICTNQYGDPVPNVAVVAAFTDYDLFFPRYTDVNGVCLDTLYAGNVYIVVVPPGTPGIHAQYHILEPNTTTVLEFTINETASADEVVLVVPRGLHAYPNPFNSTASGSVTFTYDGNTKLSKTNYIRIYDTKGRFIQQIEMDSKGTASWQPSSDVASGLYLARLISGNRIVDTATFSIIK